MTPEERKQEKREYSKAYYYLCKDHDVCPFCGKKAQKEWGCFVRNVKRATGKASKNGMKAYRRNAKSKRYKKTPCVKKPSMIHGERLGFVHIAAAFVKTKVL